jgi:hypothetical protein
MVDWGGCPDDNYPMYDFVQYANFNLMIEMIALNLGAIIKAMDRRKFIAGFGKSSLTVTTVLVVTATIG